MSHDLSLWHLFLQASPVVKGVMILLFFASVACWAIVVEKLVRFRALQQEIKVLEGMSAEPTIAFQTDTAGLTKHVITAVQRELLDRSDEPESRSEFRERIERAMRLAVAGDLRRLEPGLPFLATVGAVSPFVGLFGTVWGIMHSFTAIAQSANASLAVVAPGIAEALFATAIGLAAAIPAVIAYNSFAVNLGRASAAINTAIAEIGGRLARRPASLRVVDVAGREASV